MAASGPRLTFNTHLHVPPNFSAFTTVEDAVETSAAQGVKVIGTSNFHDFGVYDRFDAAARANGLKALFGLEFISVLDEAMRANMTVNDPANPGRAYICGKGIPNPTAPSTQTKTFMDAAKVSNEARTTQMVDRVRELFAGAGLAVDDDLRLHRRDQYRRVPRYRPHGSSCKNATWLSASRRRSSPHFRSTSGTPSSRSSTASPPRPPLTTRWPSRVSCERG